MTFVPLHSQLFMGLKFQFFPGSMHPPPPALPSGLRMFERSSDPHTKTDHPNFEISLQPHQTKHNIIGIRGVYVRFERFFDKWHASFCAIGSFRFETKSVEFNATPKKRPQSLYPASQATCQTLATPWVWHKLGALPHEVRALVAVYRSLGSICNWCVPCGAMSVISPQNRDSCKVWSSCGYATSTSRWQASDLNTKCCQSTAGVHLWRPDWHDLTWSYIAPCLFSDRWKNQVLQLWSRDRRKEIDWWKEIFRWGSLHSVF